MTSKIYVYAPTAQGHRLAGRATWAEKLGTFEYAPDWLDDSNPRRRRPGWGSRKMDRARSHGVRG